MKELVQNRTLTSKVFDLGNGQRLNRCHIGRIHYQDSLKKLLDIDTTLLPKAGGRYHDRSGYSAEVPAFSDGPIVYFNTDHHFDTRVIGINRVAGVPDTDVWGSLGKSMKYPNAFGPGIHLVLQARNNGLHKLIRFDRPPADTTKDFVVRFELLNKPSVLSYNDRGMEKPIDPTRLKANFVPLSNRRLYLYSSGKARSHMRFPKAWDSGLIRRKALPVKVGFYKTLNRFFFVKIIPKEIFQGATYPVFADDPVTYYGGAGDGYAGNETSGGASWATVRGAAGNLSDDTATTLLVRSDQFVWGGGGYTLTRGFFTYDTSAVGSSATITSVSNYLYADSKNDNDNDGDDWINIVEGFRSDDANVINSNYGDGAGNTDCGDALTNPTEAHSTAERKDISSISTAAYTTYSFNATGIAMINKTGNTDLGSREGHDAINSPVGLGKTDVSWRSSEYTGTGSDPYLDVISTPAALLGERGIGRGIIRGVGRGI